MSEGESELPDLLPERRKPRPLWVRFLYVAGALVLFAAGIVGWLVPVVTGIPFYVAAAILLAAASNRAREWVNRLERRFPRGFRVKLRRGMRKAGVEPSSEEALAPSSRKESPPRGSQPGISGPAEHRGVLESQHGVQGLPRDHGRELPRGMAEP